MNIGDLKHRVTLQSKGATQWEAQATVWAAIRYLRGAEAVVAGRLQGVNSVVITLRRTATTEAATSAWRLKNARTGAVYAIKSIIPSDDFLDLTCETS